eukprot:gnl/TRDRNA2_/TRDRNA2_85928_c1_seq1.p1 gnl/TRDRNA2_/TRDRNA2_85928_c1~~gnl/TRDRNA2_/TRDRNA2_85928_c1_seq1.p1  ORF type:complete len:469 (+),score=84.48 gnl/TRDRNA2_/TRDRNA2_85928_c1_seq1:114-1520(+)
MSAGTDGCSPVENPALGELPADVRVAKGVEVRELHRVGRGLVATRPLAAGEVILSERCRFAGDSLEALAAEIGIALAKDPHGLEPARARWNQPPPEGEGGGKVTSLIAAEANIIAAVNAFDFLDGSHWVLLRGASLLNHACAFSDEANTTLSVPFDAGLVERGDMVSVIAARDIRAGEALHLSYLCPFASAERRKTLEDAHGFRCRCSTCLAVEANTVSPKIKAVWEPLLQCCASCGTEPAGKRCGGCGIAYCSIECQKADRKEHKLLCRKGFGQERVRNFAPSAPFDAVMDASSVALRAAEEAYNGGSVTGAAELLDAAVAEARRFEATFVYGSPRLGPSNCMLYYVRGNTAKVVLSRLQLGLRSGSAATLEEKTAVTLAEDGEKAVRRCLRTCSSLLPRFHVELRSLLQDLQDLANVIVRCAVHWGSEGSGGPWAQLMSQVKGLLDEFTDVTEAFAAANAEGQKVA